MRLIRSFAIPFRVHPLLVVIVIASVVTGYFVELATLFGIVCIHEMGHIIAAKMFGWRIKEVQLLPFGGVMTTDEQGTIPASEEAIVAVSGPLLNGVMIMVAMILQQLGLWDDHWSAYFIQSNVMIGGFNLLPILPLDGGKIAQSLLSLRITYRRCITYCTWVSIVLSGLLTIASIAQLSTAGIQLNLLMIGLFLFYSNIYQLRHLPYHFIRFLMNRELRAAKWLAHGMLASPIVVRKSLYLSDVIRLLKREQYHLIYVINEQSVIETTIPEQHVIRKYLMEKRPGSAVADLFMLK